MKRCAFTLVEIMIVVAIIALLAAIAVPGVLRARLTAADGGAKASLKAAATALESYLAAQGAYPNSIDTLYTDDPKYLTVNYFDGNSYDGYTFSVDSLSNDSYVLSAAPFNCGGSGTKSIEVSTGMIFNTTDCS